MGRFLRLFTDLPLDEIARLEALAGAEINEAKKVLANEATTHAARRARPPQARRGGRRGGVRAGRAVGRPADRRGARADLEAGVLLAALAADAGLAAPAARRAAWPRAAACG